MVIYKLVGRTNPFDWATPSREVTLGLYEHRKTAEQDMDRMNAHPDFDMDWKWLRVDEVELV